MRFLLLVVQICGEIMNIVVGVLLHQIDMGLKFVYLSHFGPPAILQPRLVVTARELDLDDEIVIQHRRAGKLFTAFQRDRRGDIAAATGGGAAAPSSSTSPTSSANRASQNRRLHVAVVVTGLL